MIFHKHSQFLSLQHNSHELLTTTLMIPFICISHTYLQPRPLPWILDSCNQLPKRSSHLGVQQLFQAQHAQTELPVLCPNLLFLSLLLLKKWQLSRSRPNSWSHPDFPPTSRPTSLPLFPKSHLPPTLCQQTTIWYHWGPIHHHLPTTLFQWPPNWSPHPFSIQPRMILCKGIN